MVELKLDDDSSEICEFVKQFGNGDIKINRKGMSRLEFMSRHYEDRLSWLAEQGNIWISSYLKNSKDHMVVMARLFKQIKE
jgi:hypothetical protein